MVIAGLVIALGEVVDDAIIDVENIMRRLRLNREAGNPESAFSVVLKASLEVRSAIVFATLIVVLVFLPIFFLDGLAGSFFRPLAISYVLAVLASLGVALTLTPALSLLLLPRAANRERAGTRRSTRLLKRGYRPRCCPRSSTSREWPSSSMLVLVRADGGGGSASGRGVPAEFQRDRFPDALGREARHVARSDAPHHHSGEQRAARHSRRAQLRLAHRPRRGRRRSGRPEFHRAVDQH